MTDRDKIIETQKSIAAEMSHDDYIKMVTEYRGYMDAYYNEGTSEVSDFQYDMGMITLKEYERLHPEDIAKNSPTQVVEVSTEREMGLKIEHDVPMLSIMDVFSYDEVKDWIDTIKRKYPHAKFSVEEKIDGLSCTLRYKRMDDGKFHLILAETRGNGYVGEDVTANVRMIPSIPESFRPEDKCEHDFTDEDEIQLRGEIYMPLHNFDSFNQKAAANGDKLAANARNLAAGTLRLKNPQIVKERGLDIFIFNVQKGPKILTEDHVHGLGIIGMFMPVVYHCEVEYYYSIIEAIECIESHREKNKYDIDGAVIKLNDIAMRDEFPSGSVKWSAGHIAYKYPQKPVAISFKEIEVDTGRTGKLSFVGVLENPAQICGTSVDRVTLNNMNYIRDMKIGIGGKYGLIKSGEIIPKLVSCIEEPKEIFSVPKVCPCCGQPLTLPSDDVVDIYCENLNCPAQVIRKLDYFCGRDQINIDGLSEQKLQYLLDNGYINTEFYSIFALTHNEELLNKLSKEEGWGKRSVEKLIAAIDKARHTTFVNFMAAQGIPKIGHGQAKLIKEAMINWVRSNSKAREWYESRPEKISIIVLMLKAHQCNFDWSSIEGFGPTRVKNLTDWIDYSARNPRDFGVHIHNFGQLLKEVVFDAPEDEFALEVEMNDYPFIGLTFVVTGSVEQFKNRKELTDWIESKGGKVSGSVSKNTDMLVNNDTTSSSGKNKKAQELGIKIISESDLLKLGA